MSSSLLPIKDQAYRLHLRGNSTREIARKLNMSLVTAQKYVREVEALNAPKVEASREAAIQRLIDQWQHVMSVAWEQHEETHDPYLLNLISGTIERVAKVRGLISNTTRHEVSGPNGGSIPVEFIARTTLAEIASGSEADS